MISQPAAFPEGSHISTIAFVCWPFNPSFWIIICRGAPAPESHWAERKPRCVERPRGRRAMHTPWMRVIDRWFFLGCDGHSRCLLSFKLCPKNGKAQEDSWCLMVHKLQHQRKLPLCHRNVLRHRHWMECWMPDAFSVRDKHPKAKIATIQPTLATAATPKSVKLKSDLKDSGTWQPDIHILIYKTTVMIFPMKNSWKTQYILGGIVIILDHTLTIITIICFDEFPIKHKNPPAMEPATAASCHSHDLGPGCSRGFVTKPFRRTSHVAWAWMQD